MQDTNMPNNLPAKKTPGEGRGFWLFVVALIVLLAIVGVAYKLMTSESERVDSKPVEVKDEVTETNGDGMPDVFYSYVGEIMNIEQGKIVIEAKAENNYLVEDSQIGVLIDEETSLVKISIPKTLEEVESGESGKLFERTDIELGDLKVGDKVTVIAYENIKGKDEFTAKKVELNIVD